MKSIQNRTEITMKNIPGKLLVPAILAFYIMLVPVNSCTDIDGDGADSLDWKNSGLPEETSYRNPVWEPDLSNPSLFRGATQFYAFGDEKEWSEGLNFVVPVLRSGNLMSWSISNEAFADRPIWAEGRVSSVSGLFSKTLGTYYLAYIIGDAGIGLAYSRAPQGPYIDYGQLINPVDLGFTTCNEPFLIQAGLKFYIFFKTESGVYGSEMTVVKNSVPVLKGSLFKIAGTGFSESIIVRKSADSYYFFGTYGTDGETSIRMARSNIITGPYLDQNGSSIVDGAGTELVTGDPESVYDSPSSIGGVFSDFEGKDWIVYQVTETNKPFLAAGGERHPMMLNRIDWNEGGWPEVVIMAMGGWQKPKYILAN